MKKLEPCPTCGQMDESQTGEHPCPECGLPWIHDEALKKYELGDIVRIWVTGNIAEYQAEVVKGGTPEWPYLRIIQDESWASFTLKSGDYIIKE